MEKIILHKSTSLSIEQKALLGNVEEFIRIGKDFKRVAEDIERVVGGHNILLKDSVPSGHYPKHEFTLSILPDEQKIFIADSPAGEDFYMVELK